MEFNKMAYPEDRSLIPRIAEDLSPWFDLIEHPQYAYIELVLRGYTKGTGVELAMRELGFDRDDAYGFGDSDNDISMIESAGYGIAMGNASEGVKAAASYITANYDSLGFAKAVYEYVIPLVNSFS